ncbi:MAG TPA: plastocyanin/azurin family copper-binding protein [Thermoleophilaceae bacterium]|nr:plastocyanin/azurin family copper-binding protein [Thermoleophilaceae bacterium]
MRPHRLLPIALALVASLAAVAPAGAADVEIGVVNFAFEPSSRSIAVGDTVIWNFNSSGHTTTANRGQAERWSSGIRPNGQTFRHRFSRPGRFQYVCTPHASFMRGTITVGSDSVRDTVDAFRTTRSGSSVRVSFELNEPATVTFKLRGAERRTVRKGRLRAGRHSFRVRSLDAGSYTGTLALSDDFDKKTNPKKSFSIAG